VIPKSAIVGNANAERNNSAVRVNSGGSNTGCARSVSTRIEAGGLSEAAIRRLIEHQESSHPSGYVRRPRHPPAPLPEGAGRLISRNNRRSRAFDPVLWCVVSSVWRSSGKNRQRIGVKAPFPGFVEPELATSIDKVPSGERWIHEIKFDGYRVQVHLRDAAVKVFTRLPIGVRKRSSGVTTEYPVSFFIQRKALTI
jgi:hypothetical protein